jgi:molecular chaperone DnaK
MIENKNRLDSLIYSTEKTINDSREKIPVGLISEAEAAVADAKKAVESNNSDDFQSQLDNLTRISHRVAEALYQQTGAGATDAAGAGAQGQTGGASQDSSGKSSGADDVIDAEYIDVDENK